MVPILGARCIRSGMEGCEIVAVEHKTCESNLAEEPASLIAANIFDIGIDCHLTRRRVIYTFLEGLWIICQGNSRLSE